jgi:DNA helicase-2/ATP-dependent DNA helicase PcrA
MEENLFPHSQSMLDLEELEEERRLCYVALTRARESLYLTRAVSRLYFGSTQQNIPSRFLYEIPDALIENRGPKPIRNPFGKVAKVDDYMDDLEFDRKSFNWD